MIQIPCEKALITKGHLISTLLLKFDKQTSKSSGTNLLTLLQHLQCLRDLPYDWTHSFNQPQTPPVRTLMVQLIPDKVPLTLGEWFVGNHVTLSGFYGIPIPLANGWSDNILSWHSWPPKTLSKKILKGLNFSIFSLSMWQLGQWSNYWIYLTWFSL